MITIPLKSFILQRKDAMVYSLFNLRRKKEALVRSELKMACFMSEEIIPMLPMTPMSFIKRLKKTTNGYCSTPPYLQNYHALYKKNIFSMAIYPHQPTR